MKRKDRQEKVTKARDYDAGSRGRETPPGEGTLPPRTNDDDRAEVMSLAELIAEADVTVRTVRYYIAEGLLPPPVGAGPVSSYGRGHLDRLRLIQRLKEAYLPLKEIRRRLAGLDDDEVRVILAAGADVAEATSLHETAADATLAEARDYLKVMMESRAGYRTRPMAFMMADLPASARQDAEAAIGGRDPEASAGREHSPAFSLAKSRRLPDEGNDVVPPSAGDDALWRRIPLGDEAELVISDQIYLRQRERVDWLVRWARKVFA